MLRPTRAAIVVLLQPAPASAATCSMSAASASSAVDAVRAMSSRTAPGADDAASRSVTERTRAGDHTASSATR